MTTNVRDRIPMATSEAADPIPAPRAAYPPSPVAPAAEAAPEAAGRRRGTRLDAAYEPVKRTLDLAASLVLLTAALPVIAVAAVLIRLESPGPVFYRATRVGHDGKVVRVLKFRSMFIDAEARLARLLDDEATREEFGRTYKLRNDPRMTRVGRLLRRTSIDEIPQFWNVITGDMSLVGPRPVTLDELRLYAAVDGGLEAYLSVRPGITGLWQVSGRSNTSYEERISLDKAYVDARSLWLDLRILVKTPLAVLTGDGAF